MIAAAAAADMPMPTKALPPAVVAGSWAGPYAGVDLGGAWSHLSFTDVDNLAFLLPGGTNDNFWSDARAGFTAGGLIGYNWQFGNVVSGLEADLNWVDGKSSIGIPINVYLVTASSNLQWLSTARARLGLTYDNSTLFYATGGLAAAHFSDSWGIPGITASDNSTRMGWTAGGGVERMFAPNWTGRIEALYADFGTDITNTIYNGQSYRTQFQHSVTLVRGALSYKW
jgi:outer membrane immunogenic protein